MNLERLGLLADHLERPGIRFYMASWDHCIAGHCRELFSREAVEAQQRLESRSTGTIARDILNLTNEQAETLFNPVVQDTGLADVVLRATGAGAAKVIRNLMTTGRVDWTVVPYTRRAEAGIHYYHAYDYFHFPLSERYLVEARPVRAIERTMSEYMARVNANREARRAEQAERERALLAETQRRAQEAAMHDFIEEARCRAVVGGMGDWFGTRGLFSRWLQPTRIETEDLTL